MTLHGLFEKLREKNFHYFVGNTNKSDASIYVEFSTKYGGRGDTIELAINPNSYDVTFQIDGEIASYDDIDEFELINYLNQL